MVEKCDFLQVVKIPFPKNRFLVNLKPLFSSYIFFPGQGWLLPVRTSEVEYLDEKMSSLAGLKKSYLISRKGTDFGHF